MPLTLFGDLRLFAQDAKASEAVGFNVPYEDSYLVFHIYDHNKAYPAHVKLKYIFNVIPSNERISVLSF